MNSSNSRLRGLTLSLAWVAAGALGTAAPFQLPYASSTSRDLGFTGAQSAMPSLTLSADLDGDHREDVVVLAGGDLNVFFAASSFYAPLEVPCPNEALGVVVLPDQGTDGKDVLVTVGSAGLTSWEYDLVAEQLQPTLLPFPGWGAVRVMRAGDWSKDGNVNDLIGLNANGGTVFVALDVLSSPVVASSMASPEPILAAAFVEGYADPGDTRELALLGKDNLWIHNLDGTQIPIPIGRIQSGRLTVLDIPGSSLERVAITAKPENGTNFELRVMDAFGSEPILDLGIDDVVGVSAGDLNYDEIPDLAFSRKAGSEVLILQSAGAGVTPTYSAPGPGDMLVVGASDAPVKGHPLLADLTRNGRVDLAYPRRRAGGSRLMVFPHSGPLAISAGGFELIETSLEECVVANKFNDRLVVSLPPEEIKVPSLQCIVWRHVFEGGGIERFATRAHLIQNPNWWVDGDPASGVQVIELTLDDSMGGAFPELEDPQNPGQPYPHPPTYAVTGDIFFYEIRPVRLNAAGDTVLDAGESFFIGHFSLADDLNGVTGLLAAYWPGHFDIDSTGQTSAYTLETRTSLFDLGWKMAFPTATGYGLAEGEVNMYQVLGNEGVVDNVRMVDPSGVPVPGLPPVAGTGRPTTSAATPSLASLYNI